MPTHHQLSRRPLVYDLCSSSNVEMRLSTIELPPKTMFAPVHPSSNRCATNGNCLQRKHADSEDIQAAVMHCVHAMVAYLICIAMLASTVGRSQYVSAMSSQLQMWRYAGAYMALWHL